MKLIELTPESKSRLLEDLLMRSPSHYQVYAERVQAILDRVREEGDAALFDYTRQFDGADINAGNIEVTSEEIEEAYTKVPADLLATMRRSAENIRHFHQLQKRNSWFQTTEDGTILGQKITPLRRAGVYVPGGTAAYPSSTMMNILPAKVAGVTEIIMITPPGKDGKINPATLVAASEAGADRIFKAGGAQAIAALAFGTESVPKVDKIVGPGNIYVALAKKAVYGYVSIDSVAGPSEVLVLADDTADVDYVVADLLSQAEHDKLASAILVTPSLELAKKVGERAWQMAKQLPRREIIEDSLNRYGYLLVTKDLAEAIEVANDIASEHMEILTANPFEVMTKIRNA
ncbi:MAG: histidinol dehydrogenase, partial [Lachnospiraceae bacterium]|nr:histidinol dehydrogenase [Lachnospiraceae bacterium]